MRTGRDKNVGYLSIQTETLTNQKEHKEKHTYMHTCMQVTDQCNVGGGWELYCHPEYSLRH